MKRSATVLVALALATSAFVGAVAAQDTATPADEASATITYEGEALVLHNGPGQQISGETNLDEGTVVTVFVESDSAEHPFLRTPEAVVGEDGSFTANVSLDDVDARADAIAEVRLDNRRISDEVPVELRPCNGQCPDETVPSGPENDSSSTEQSDGEDGETTDTDDGADDGDGSDASFEEHVELTYRGETARLNLSLGDEETVAVAVTNDDVGYEAVATLRDADADGRVPVLFDTAVGTTDEPIRVAGSTDAVVNSSQTRGDVDGALPAEVYDVDVYRTAALQERIEVGSLSVEELTEAPAPSDDANGAAGTASTGQDDGADGGDGDREDGDETAEDGGGETPIPTDRDALLVGGGIVGVLGVVGVGARLLR